MKIFMLRMFGSVCRSSILFILLTLAALFRCETVYAGTSVDSGFTESVLANTNGLITSLAWAPDGSNRLFATLKDGRAVIVENGTLVRAPFYTFTPYTKDECGLLSVAFDPNYSINRFVYFFYTVSASEQRIVRLTDSNNVGTALTPIVVNLPTAGINHDGGSLAIGPDHNGDGNYIFWGIGNNGNINSAGEGDDYSTLASKIGRVRLDGTPPNDNPFYNAADGIGPTDYIWARGFRNPFTMTFQNRTKKLWVNVVGDLYEQSFIVNRGDYVGDRQNENRQPRGPIPSMPPKIAYRSNNIEEFVIVAAPQGAVRQNGVVTFTTSTEHFLKRGTKLTVTGAQDPSFNGTFYVASTPAPTKFTVVQAGVNGASGAGKATVAKIGGCMTGGTFYESTSFPVQYRGNFFWGDCVSGNIYRASFDQNNEVTQIDQFLVGAPGLIDTIVGPDGALYYGVSSGQIYRLQYTATAQSLIVEPTSLNVGEGGIANFNVRLSNPPQAPVVVSVARTTGDSSATVIQGASLTFTAANYATSQLVRISAAEDVDTVGGAAQFAVTSPGITTQTVSVAISDNDTLELLLSVNSLALTEGIAGTLTARLSHQPAANVTINVARSAGDPTVTINAGATLTFTPANYATPQTVSVLPIQDGDSIDETAVVTLSGAGVAPRQVNITVRDDDSSPPQFTSTPSVAAVQGASYLYDVQATGLPAPTYSLVNAPPQMTIDSTTGVIQWTPAATGSFPVTVRAANAVNPDVRQTFTIVVAPDLAPTCVITKPVQNETVGGTGSEFFGDGHDDVTTVRAEFYIDDVLRYTDVNRENHFHINGSHNLWDTTLLSNGVHRLRMKVYDETGKSGSCDVAVSVYNAPPTYPVTVKKSGNGAGIVSATTDNISLINCGADCAKDVAAGSLVTLTATPQANSNFIGWSGACSGLDVCRVTMSAAREVTAAFSLKTFPLTVIKAGDGTGTVTGTFGATSVISCPGDCGETVQIGSQITLTAAPSANTNFTGWTGGGCSGTGSCVVTLDAAKSVTATFALKPFFALTVTKSGSAAAGGTVTGTSAAGVVINCGSDCGESSNTGDRIVLTAVPAANANFIGWGGACSGTGTCEVALTAARAVTANFALKIYRLTVVKADTGSGVVTGTLNGADVVNCGGDCIEDANADSVITLIATPSANSTFGGWGGACTGTTSCQVTLNSAKSVTATFTPKAFVSLSVGKAGNGDGTITGISAGATVINCGADCTESSNSGAQVTLTATPNSNATFIGWSGACTGAASCIVTIDAAKSVSATFTLKSFTLTVNKVDTGAGTITGTLGGTTVINCGLDCTESANADSLIRLVATAAADSNFSGWSGSGCTGNGVCEVTLNAVKTVSASFTPKSSFALTVSKVGNGGGTVTGTANNATVINCGADCTESSNTGPTVTLVATPNANANFTGWGGACSGTATCQVPLTAARAVTATFTLKLFPLTVTKTGTGNGTVFGVVAGTTIVNCGADCNENLNADTQVTLSAVPNANATFTGWNLPSCSGVGACVVSMSVARTVTATFTLKPSYALTIAKTGSGSVVGRIGQTELLNCGVTCSAPVLSGTSVVLTATPVSGSSFSGWSGGGCSGSALTCTTTISAITTVSATFTSSQKVYQSYEAEQATLTAPMATFADGIASGGVGIRSVSEESGTALFTIQITNPGTYYIWTRVLAEFASSNSFYVTLAGGVDVFEVDQAALSSQWQWVRVNGRGAANVPGSLNPRTFTLNADTYSLLFRSREANTRLDAIIVTNDSTFIPGGASAANVTLSVLSGGPGAGKVSGSGIACPGDCSEVVKVGSVVTLQAIPEANSRFGSWSGICNGDSSPCTALMMNNADVGASFFPLPALPAPPTEFRVIK